MRRISLYITVALMLLSSCKYREFTIGEEFEEYSIYDRTPDLACLYTRQAMMKYTDLMFTLHALQDYLNDTDDKNLLEQYGYVGNQIRIEEIPDVEGQSSCYRLTRFSEREGLIYRIKVHDADQKKWMVEARSEEIDDTLSYQMMVEVNGDSWTISNASSNILGVHNRNNARVDELEHDRYVTFSGSNIQINILWEQDEENNLYAIINTNGTLESLIAPKLVMNFNTIRPLIVIENSNLKDVGRYNSSLNVLYNCYFTQWIGGKIEINVDNEDGSRDEIIAEMLTPTKVKAYFKGQESEWEW